MTRLIATGAATFLLYGAGNLAQANQVPQTPGSPDTEVDKVIEHLLPHTRGAEDRRPLPTAVDALAYAEVVIRATDGATAWERQAPYSVSDDADTWLIRGSRSRMPGVLDPVEIRLRKADASVVDYGMGFMGGMSAPPR